MVKKIEIPSICEEMLIILDRSRILGPQRAIDPVIPGALLLLVFPSNHHPKFLNHNTRPQATRTDYSQVVSPRLELKPS